MGERVPDAVVRRCADGFLERRRASREAAEERARRLVERAREAACMLARDYGATRVWLFGSLAWGSPHPRTDVDLLVEGLPASEWLRAGAAAEHVVEAPLDLVRAEDAPAGLVERVRREGRLLVDVSR